MDKTRYNIIFAIFAAFGILLIHELWVQQQTVEPVPYSELEQLLQQGKVAELTIREHFISGELKQPDANGKTIVVANRVDPKLAEQLTQYNVPFTQVYESKFFSTLLSWILPALVFVGIWQFISTWNEFFLALIILTRDEVKTLTIVPMQYSGLYMANPGALFAILTLIALPLILLYVLVQRAFVRGLLAGAVKG